MTLAGTLRRLSTLGWVVTIGLGNPALAAGSPIVRITATPQEVRVGEPVTLQITVLVPTWFPRPPAYPSFELTNAITRLPADSSFPTSERLDGETWSGIVRNYRIYPLLAATYRLANRKMTVTYVHPQSYRALTVATNVPDIEFRAVVPPGAEGLDPYLAGRDLTVTREIEGDIDALEPGDALVVQYAATLDGMPAVFLPSLVGDADLPGVSVYADEPIVEDLSGDPPRSRRTERLTLVFPAGGEFAVPGVVLRWWNTATRSVEPTSIAELPVTVTGTAGKEAGAVIDAADSPRMTTAVAALLAGASILAVLGLWRRGPGLRDRWLAWRRQRRHSAAHAFTRLRKSLRRADPPGAYRAWLTWVARLDPPTEGRPFAAAYGDEELRLQSERLSRSLFASATVAPDLPRLDRALRLARRTYRQRRVKRAQSVLPALNPSLPP